MAYEAYRSKIPSLSAGWERERQMAQETEARNIAEGNRRDANQFNFGNALTRAVASLVAGGGPANPMAWLSAGVSALGADRGKEFKPLESVISGLTTGTTAAKMPGGGDILKTASSAIDTANLNTTLPFLQSLKPGADSLSILGDVATKNLAKEEKEKLKLEAIQKDVRDAKLKIYTDPLTKPEVREELGKDLGMNIESLKPIDRTDSVSEKSMLTTGDIYNQKPTDESTKLSIEKARREAEQKALDISLAPKAQEFTAKVSQALEKNDRKWINQIEQRGLFELSGSPELLAKLNDKIASARKDIATREQAEISRYDTLTNQDLNRSIAAGNRDIAESIRREGNNQRREDKIRAEENRKIDKFDTKRMINMSGPEYSSAKEGLTAIRNAIEIYNRKPSVSGKSGAFVAALPGDYGDSAQFRNNIQNAIDIIARKRTGAVIKDSEMKLYNKIFSPGWMSDTLNKEAKMKALERTYAEVIYRLENPGKTNDNIESLLKSAEASTNRTTTTQTKSNNVVKGTTTSGLKFSMKIKGK